MRRPTSRSDSSSLTCHHGAAKPAASSHLVRGRGGVRGRIRGRDRAKVQVRVRFGAGARARVRGNVRVRAR